VMGWILLKAYLKLLMFRQIYSGGRADLIFPNARS
jgi:hypothetical protein